MKKQKEEKNESDKKEGKVRISFRVNESTRDLWLKRAEERGFKTWKKYFTNLVKLDMAGLLGSTKPNEETQIDTEKINTQMTLLMNKIDEQTELIQSLKMKELGLKQLASAYEPNEKLQSEILALLTKAKRPLKIHEIKSGLPHEINKANIREQLIPISELENVKYDLIKDTWEVI